jgi:hypothetical protein
VVSRAPRRTRPMADVDVLQAADASLLDLVDNVLTKGIMITGDVVIGLADIDLVYLRLSALLCAADRVLPSAPKVRRR